MTESSPIDTKADWWRQPARPLDHACEQRARERQSQLTKPPGSLGRLEEVAIHLAALQHNDRPRLDKVQISIFAGDHGVVAEGVSAFPQIVTVEMQRNFVNGGAAISVLARQLGATLEVINAGTFAVPAELSKVIHEPVAQQTHNFCEVEAMSDAQWQQALAIGYRAVQRAQQRQAQLFIGGEMGIGNTTSATALLCALTGLSPQDITGAGTGLDSSGIEHKISVIEKALTRHQALLQEPAAVSRALGGFEIAALTGAYIAAAQVGIAVLVDGFICSAAALCALKLNPSIRNALFFSHCSAEQGHRKVMAHLYAAPLVDLNLRLGEGSGAAVVVPLLRAACALHNEMATFAEAAVSGKSAPASSTPGDP
ncbi:MAG TPA: nicotinate-nucleotide--dimethylbenzimidazole phosphoribosyltransferase [Dongiaceae bacterium]|nr:nicotinate-nucleotide--dimethylbenzimidazole phosphoribosyltransferase [Dongiaceae bacterium]